MILIVIFKSSSQITRMGTKVIRWRWPISWDSGLNMWPWLPWIRNLGYTWTLNWPWIQFSRERIDCFCSDHFKNWEELCIRFYFHAKSGSTNNYLNRLSDLSDSNTFSRDSNVIKQFSVFEKLSQYWENQYKYFFWFFVLVRANKASNQAYKSLF